MSTLKISLDADQDPFVEEQVSSGVYADAKAVVRTALDRFREDEAARAERYRAKVQQGLDDLAAGRTVKVDD
jgi:putative addiction module CopG family antidote